MYPLVERLQELGHLEVGFGPRHPVAPNPTIAGNLEMFFAQYPFLRQDQGYVDFLECYAGLYLERPDDELILDIFGFTDVSSNIMGLEGPIVDNDGFLTFCDGTVRSTETNNVAELCPLSFSFDATQNRTKGVYYTTRQSNYWYCESFLDWLEIIVTTRGKLSFAI
jgi:hypothetical protein